MLIMKLLDEYVNKAGQFWLKGKRNLAFPALITSKNAFEYELRGNLIQHELTKEICKLQEESREMVIHGIFGNVHILLLGCHMKESFHYNLHGTAGGRWCSSVVFFFEDALIGSTFFKSEMGVSKAEVQLERLDQFFEKKPYYCSPEEKAFFVESQPPRHDTQKYGLRFVWNLKPTVSLLELTPGSLVSLEFTFADGLQLLEARKHIAQFRMLLSLFKLNHLNIENIKLYINGCKSHGSSKREIVFEYFLNLMPQGAPELWPVSTFCLKYDDLMGGFTDIVNGWIQFQETAGPVVEILYEILINRSHDINMFFNHWQAMEVFSNRFRKKEAKALSNTMSRDPQRTSKRKKRHCNRRDTATNWHRALDLLMYVNSCFGFAELDLRRIAKWIVDTRNYYTHYGRESAHVLTDYGDRGAVNTLMHYLLAILIYNNLGVDMGLIADKFYHPIFKPTLEQIQSMLQTRSD